MKLRNPLFGGLLTALFGASILWGSWLMALSAIGAILCAHAWVVWHEEPILLERFGSAYAAYLRHVPRWLPARRAR